MDELGGQSRSRCNEESGVTTLRFLVSNSRMFKIKSKRVKIWVWDPPPYFWENKSNILIKRTPHPLQYSLFKMSRLIQPTFASALLTHNQIQQESSNQGKRKYRIAITWTFQIGNSVCVRLLCKLLLLLFDNY